MKKMLSADRCICLLLLSLFSLSVLPSSHATEYPPPGTNNAFVQVSFNEIADIDGVEQSFHGDFYMLTSWVAPIPPTGPYSNKTVDVLTSMDLSGAELAKYFWAPQLEFINERAEVTRLVDEPFAFVTEPLFDMTRVIPGYVQPANSVWITEDQRYQCDFFAPLTMDDFPFDQQYMQLIFESFWDSNQVKIIFAKSYDTESVVPPRLKDSIVGWKYAQTDSVDLDKYYPYNDRWYNRMILRVRLIREPQYYLVKIVAVVMLVIYMCVWVFALQVDEADRMMGTLQLYVAGLVTMLFVASSDTPKVPYQTRLDLFMLWSFFNIAFILFVHGTLYYWREDDVEEILDEREQAEEEDLKREAREKRMRAAGFAGEEEKAPPRRNGSHSSKVHPSLAAAPEEEVNIPSNKWRIRYDEWSEFSLRKWYNGLHLTRKWDAIFIPLTAIMYSVGVAVILGRAVDGVRNAKV